jgi:hypothetical protein
VVDEVGARARNLGELLDGRLPPGLLDRAARVWPGEVQATCTCSEQRPCRHEAAAHHAMATALVRDPVRLLRFRGRSVEELLAAVRASHGPAVDESAAEADAASAADPYVAQGDLEAVVVHPAPVADAAAMFARLGPPPGIEQTDRLEDLVEDAAALAWRLAAGQGAEVADDEALLTELRAQGVATGEAIAASLGLDEETATAALDRLYAAGQVLRMGQGEAARYRAAG